MLEVVNLSNLDFEFDFTLRDQALTDLAQRLASSTVDTRRALAGYVPKADAYQQQVIEATEDTVRVLAPAGSGKTQTMVNRVLTQLRNGQNAKQILILTFDNAAVTSIRTKLQEQLAVLALDRNYVPTISTLNAYGYGILRDYLPAEHKPIVSNSHRRSLLREVKDALKEKSLERFNALPTNLSERFYLEFFSVLKNEVFDPRQLNAQQVADFMLERTETTAPFFSTATPEVVAKVIQAVIWMYMGYDLALQREQRIDFDDQKLRAHLGLLEDPNLLRQIQGRYTEVIVDEFQDINRLDFVFIQSIAAKARLVVTGDDDQAIYGFRGCTPDFIINLEQHLGRRVTSYELSANYRCPPNLVEHANRLIRHNTHRVEKHPVAKRKEPAAIKVVSTVSAGLEAKFVVKYIRKIKQATPELQYKDFAVLYRTNAQSLPLQVEFILNDLPYYVRDEDNLLQNQTLDRLLAVLRVQLALATGREPDSSDAVALVQAYFAYVAAAEVNELLNLFGRGGRLLETLGSEPFYRILPKARQSNLLPTIQTLVRAKTLMETLDLLTKNFNGLSGMIGSLEDVVAERVPLGEIYELAANFKGKTQDFVRTLEGALERARQTNAGTDRDSGIGLLTYFRAKGLQWHTVILTTCNEGLIPHRKANVEDERRLFYVALTRASSNLLISHVQKACGNQVTASRFLQEAGLL